MLRLKKEPPKRVVKEVSYVFDSQRECTRCDGLQHLLGEKYGLGKYKCDTCEIVICFDLEASPVEYISNRGMPQKYSKNIFGRHLQTNERRLP